MSSLAAHLLTHLRAQPDLVALLGSADQLLVGAAPESASLPLVIIDLTPQSARRVDDVTLHADRLTYHIITPLGDPTQLGDQLAAELTTLTDRLPGRVSRCTVGRVCPRGSCELAFDCKAQTATRTLHYDVLWRRTV